MATNDTSDALTRAGNVLVPLVELVAERAAQLILERQGGAREADVCNALHSSSPFLTIPEAAELLRCKRQRIDDLLSRRRLTRHKEGSRTLVDRAEVLALVQPDGRGRVAPVLPLAARSRTGSRPAA
jgi:excisionase family DNA binding protein